MYFPYITLGDNTEITHSKLQKDGTVKVYIEKAIPNGFKNATCTLPSYEWINCNGYSKKELKGLETFVRQNAHLIMEYAKEGGFANAAAL